MKPMRLWALGMAAAALLACDKGKEQAAGNPKAPGEAGATPAPASAIRVVTAVAEARSFEDWGDYPADLRGSEDAVLLSPPAGGRVVSVAEVGKTAAKGQALCDIESDRYRAMLLQAKAALDLAQGELERMRSNVDKGFVGKAVLDKAELDYQGARVAHLQALRAYEDSRCQAPFAGMLVSRSINRHQSVPPGSPTVRVSGLERLEAEVSIPESEAFAYREGQRAEFVLLQDPSLAVAGKIRSLDRAVEARNRTVMARIELPNPGRKLRPGMVGKARILRKQYDSAVVVPSQSVLRLQSGTAMMKVEGGVARKADVKLGPARGDSVVVQSGLQAGERYITVGGFQVSDGTQVEYEGK